MQVREGYALCMVLLLRHSMLSVQAQLLYLDAADPGRDITMYVNSPGGSVTAGMAVFDTMRHVRPDVSTVCVGLAASMGAFLLTAGHQVLPASLYPCAATPSTHAHSLWTESVAVLMPHSTCCDAGQAVLAAELADHDPSAIGRSSGPSCRY